MQRPPENEKPAPVAQTGSGLELVSRAADAQLIAPLPWPWQAIGDVVADVLDKVFAEHFGSAPERLKNKLYATVSPTVAGDALVHFARVRFESYRFDLDQEGRWALVLPVFDGGEIVDFGAFDVEDDKMRRPYTNAYSIGFESSLWDAHYHPNRRFLLHADPWSYLRAECVGCIPISWRKTSLQLIENDIRDVLFMDDIQAAKGSNLIAAALRPPRSFIRQERAA